MSFLIILIIKSVFILMQYVTKNTCIITFLDSYKNVSDRSVARENIFAKNVVIRSSVKLALRCIFYV